MSSLRDPPLSAVSSVRSRSPPIFGPITQNDDVGITEPHGEWRGEEEEEEEEGKEEEEGEGEGNGKVGTRLSQQKQNYSD